MSKFEITMTAINEAGRKKHIAFEAEYGTDEEAYLVFRDIYRVAGDASFRVVEETHGWEGNLKAVGKK